ncbi:MAG: hypothetical protein M3083_19900 [Actinomycetota bacterium]|nr:hypothetical protein [Actinomycetota bacterium]
MLVVAGVRAGNTKTVVVLVRGDIEVAVWPLPDAGRPDLSLIDRLARLELAARGLGCTIRLRDASEPLCELLDLAGLSAVLRRAGGLLVEMGREPEGREEVGVQEGVEPGDPAARDLDDL